MNKITHNEYEVENLMKTQVFVTTFVFIYGIIQKLQIDEETFNTDSKEIHETIMDIFDQFQYYTS